MLECGEVKTLYLINPETDMKLDIGPGDSFSLRLVDVEYDYVLWEETITVG